MPTKGKLTVKMPCPGYGVSWNLRQSMPGAFLNRGPSDCEALWLITKESRGFDVKVGSLLSLLLHVETHQRCTGINTKSAVRTV